MEPAVSSIADEVAMAEADEELRALADAYPAYARAELDDLASALERLRSGTEPVDPDALFLPAHNLKGQGAAFGYDLITTLAEALCAKVRDCASLTPTDQSIVARLIGACRLVLAQRLTGDGGPDGSRLLADLSLQSS